MTGLIDMARMFDELDKVVAFLERAEAFDWAAAVEAAFVAVHGYSCGQYGAAVHAVTFGSQVRYPAHCAQKGIPLEDMGTLHELREIAEWLHESGVGDGSAAVIDAVHLLKARRN